MGTDEVDNLYSTTPAALYGLAGNDSLRGSDFDDILDGGADADQMHGGWGDDVYYVDNAGDYVIDWSGHDEIRTTVSYTTTAPIERMTLLGTAIEGYVAYSGASVITGNASNNVLRGNGGGDTFIGGLGNDSYWVGSSSDAVVEQAGEGTDTVHSGMTSTRLRPMSRTWNSS